MKQLYWVLVMGLLIAGIVGCRNPIGPGAEPQPEPELVDGVFWFEDIYLDLLGREPISMGQIANCQYVCDAINVLRGTSIVPESGTAGNPANCEYLLKMIDQYVNNGLSNYGTGQYATNQVVDKIAVDGAVERLGKKFISLRNESTKIVGSP